MTLHEVIIQVIDTIGNLSPKDIADYINKTRLYQKRDLSNVTPNQIRARIRQYSHLLKLENGLVYKNNDLDRYNELDKRWANGEDVGLEVIELRDKLWKEGKILINGYTYKQYQERYLLQTGKEYNLDLH